MIDRVPITIAVKCPTCGSSEPKLFVLGASFSRVKIEDLSAFVTALGFRADVKFLPSRKRKVRR